MYIQIESITPEKAKQYLEKNTNNYRGVNRGRVHSYANDMKKGLWQSNGEAIKFAENGTLLDGQHRLMAIVESGVTLEYPVVYDVKNDVDLFDIGSARSTTQIATKMGIRDGARSNACIAAAGAITVGGFSSQGLSKGLTLEYLKDNEMLFEKAYRIAVNGNKVPIARRASCIAAVFYMLKHGKPDGKLYSFFSSVNSGFPAEGVESSSAIVMRNWLLKQKDGVYRDSLENRRYLYSITIQAFSDFEAGVRRQVVYRLSEKTCDEFKRFSDLEMEAYKNGN